MERFRPQPGLAALAAILTVAVAVPSHGQQVAGACATLNAPGLFVQAGGPAGRLAELEGAMRGTRLDASVPPPSPRELQQLGRTLDRLGRIETSGDALQALFRGEPLEPARFGVLVGDARALLLELHAIDIRRSIEELPQPPELPPWFRAGLEGMHACGLGRFERRGGEVAHAAALALVREFRSSLEPWLLAAPGRPLDPPANGSRPRPPILREGRR